MKKWVGWVLLALSLYVTYEGWRNSQPSQATEDLSKAEACRGREGCTVEGTRPVELRTDFFGRDYTWKTSAGPSRWRVRARTCSRAPGPAPRNRPREGARQAARATRLAMPTRAHLLMSHGPGPDAP